MFEKVIPYIALVLLFSCGVDKPDFLEEAEKKLPEVIDYNYHIKPILSDRCFVCHGPDKGSLEANLRLDIADSAYKILSSGNGYGIKPGSLKNSEVFHRIVSQDPSYMMPPPDANLALTPNEIALITKWIEQGAKYKPHWSFIPPKKSKIPSVKNKEFISNEIDNFILKKLASNNIPPSKQANKEELIRRVYMDLSGLPPSLEKIDKFLADKSESAYEKMVDEVLASKACAERLTLDWLDVARYADSHGLHSDGPRTMWPWRDWVIKAFDSNMPYNQFIKWQIAGDMYPNATKEMKLATAFNRNHVMTPEGGVIDEEWRLEYVFDRSTTSATAFLGMTMMCSKCHDHKYDPLSQKEYYQMAAFFNNVRELGMIGEDWEYGPLLMLPDKITEKKLKELDDKIKTKKQKLQLTKEDKEKILTSVSEQKNQITIQPPKPQLYLSFEKMFKYTHQPPVMMHWSVEKNPIDFKGLDNDKRTRINGTPKLVTGFRGKGLEINSEYNNIDVEKAGMFEMTEPFSSGIWFNTNKDNINQVLVCNTGEKNSFWRGWEFYIDSSMHLVLKLINSPSHNYFYVRSNETVKKNEWTNAFFTYDGSGLAEGVKFYINGQLCGSTILYNKLYGSIKGFFYHDYKENIYGRFLRIGRSNRIYGGEYGIFSGVLDEFYVFDDEVSSLEINTIIGNETDSNDELLAEHYLLRKDPAHQSQREELKKLYDQRLAIVSDVLEIMVMEDFPHQKPMRVLDRGEYHNPLEIVEPSTPSAILPFPDDLPKNRIGFAEWLVDDKNPLTARVTVNRYWQMIFGNGLVKTAHDFGAQGALPSHPELLDWLSVHFRESGWNVKALLKMMVLSSTYKQTSVEREDLNEIDPNNLLLAKSPSYRYPAEFIRDNALMISGLLVNEIGGPSVKPYQPKGLWREKSNFSMPFLEYKKDSGAALHRRSMYTILRRTSMHPAMEAFDAPTREVCIVKRENTNTPLQALVLLNDPQFIEASIAFAVRMQRKGGDSSNEKIAYAFRLATGRNMTKEESSILVDLYESELIKFKINPDKTDKLLSIGDYQLSDTINKNETAAYTIVANMILNHDAVYMKR